MDPVPPAPSVQPIVPPPISTVIPASRFKTHIFVWIIEGIIILGVGITGGLFLGKQIYSTTPTYTNLPTASTTPDIPLTNQEICEQNSGAWLEEFRECEHISQSLCKKLGGNFNECESPCRHDLTADKCITLCVRVCKLN